MIALKRRAFLLASAAAVFVPGMPVARKAPAAGKSSMLNPVQDGEWMANFSLERDGRVMESKTGSVRQHAGTLIIQAPEGMTGNAQSGDVFVITYSGMRLS